MYAFLLKRKLEDLSSDWKAVTHLLQELRAKQPGPAPVLTTVGARKYAESHALWLQPFVQKHNSEVISGCKGKSAAIMKIGINFCVIYYAKCRRVGALEISSDSECGMTKVYWGMFSGTTSVTKKGTRE